MNLEKERSKKSYSKQFLLCVVTYNFLTTRQHWQHGATMASAVSAPIFGEMTQRVQIARKHLLIQSKVMVGALEEGMLVTLWKIRKEKKKHKAIEGLRWLHCIARPQTELLRLVQLSGAGTQLPRVSEV